MNKDEENYAVVSIALKKMGFAEAPPRANYMEKTRKLQVATIAFGDFHLPWRSLFSPFHSDVYLPKKEEVKSSPQHSNKLMVLQSIILVFSIVSICCPLQSHHQLLLTVCPFSRLWRVLFLFWKCNYLVHNIQA